MIMIKLGYGEDNDGWYVSNGDVQIAHGLSRDMAALLVAAPEMLEALKEARGWVDLASDMGRDNSQALAMINAVIAKAEGRS